MNSIQNLTRLFVFVLLIALVPACKSKKKAMEASSAANEKARMEQEAALKKQQEEAARKAEADELARKEAEASRASNESASAPKAKLDQYFTAIASANNVNSANSSINEALGMFASPETPVLIVISESGGMKDYDRPTTIREYLHYLKDQKKNINAISDLKVDGSGKITEVELRKN